MILKSAPHAVEVAVHAVDVAAHSLTKPRGRVVPAIRIVNTLLFISYAFRHGSPWEALHDVM